MEGLLWTITCISKVVHQTRRHAGTFSSRNSPSVTEISNSRHVFFASFFCTPHLYRPESDLIRFVMVTLKAVLLQYAISYLPFIIVGLFVLMIVVLHSSLQRNFMFSECKGKRHLIVTSPPTVAL